MKEEPKDELIIYASLSPNCHKKIKMQVANETKVIFWDRLKELKRIKEDGEVVSRGSIGGENVVRIHDLNMIFLMGIFFRNIS